MGHVTMHAHVNAPIEMVFDYCCDMRRASEWNVQIIEMKGEGPLAKVGDRFSGTMKFMGRVYQGEGHVTAFERPVLLAFESSNGEGGRQDWTTHYTRSGTGTDMEVEIDYEFPLGFLGGIADKLFVERMVQRDLNHSRDNFLAILEQLALQPV